MRVVTIGTATVDIIVSGPPARPNAGTKQEVEHIGLYAGGGAVNTALGFQSLGASVSIVCAVGPDVEGQWLRDTLASHGVGVDGMQTVPGEPTGKAVVHVGTDGEAWVFAQRGASTKLALADCGSAVCDTDMRYVSSLSARAQADLLTVLRAEGADRATRSTRLVINPGARQLAEPDTGLRELCTYTHLLCLNAVEGQVLNGAAVQDTQAALSTEAAMALATRLSSTLGPAVLLTLGSAGAVFVEQGNGIFQPSCPATVASTLGAGDAFASTFAWHWAQGASAEQALVAAAQRASDVLGAKAANLAGLLAQEVAQ